MRRNSLKVKPLWVINSLANPRPTLEKYTYAMPGDADIPQSSLEIFDVASKAKVVAKADAFKDQGIQIEVDRPTDRAREHEKTESLWAGPGSDKIYFNRLSRDMHRLDLCVADTSTGEVKPIIQERMNVYIESKPIKVINNGSELVWWSERDGWGHYYLYGADGTLKNQVDKGEYVAEDISAVDDKDPRHVPDGIRPRRRRRSVLHALLSREPGWQRDEDAGCRRCVACGRHGGFRQVLRRYLLAGRHGARVGARKTPQGATVMPLEKVDVAPLTAGGI